MNQKTRILSNKPKILNYRNYDTDVAGNNSEHAIFGLLNKI